MFRMEEKIGKEGGRTVELVGNDVKKTKNLGRGMRKCKILPLWSLLFYELITRSFVLADQRGNGLSTYKEEVFWLPLRLI